MGYQEQEISGDEEGDPIWKPSNTNETEGRRRSETAENPKLNITCSLFEQILHRSSNEMSEQSTNIKKYKSTKYS